jgi:hypothetical protein
MLEWKVSCLLTVTWFGKLEIRLRENAVEIIQGPYFTQLLPFVTRLPQTNCICGQLVGSVTSIQKSAGRKWQLTVFTRNNDPILPSKNKKVVIKVDRESL